ncbi:MAG: hypothetical protein ACM30I_02665 [Gemmatimonas sp.]
MDIRRRYTGAGSGAGALAAVGHVRVVRWTMASVLLVGMLAAPRPALSLDSLQAENGAMAMVLLLSLGQALAQKPGPVQPADRVAKDADRPVQPAAATVPADVPAASDVPAVAEATPVAAPTPLLPAKPVVAPAPDAR